MVRTFTSARIRTVVLSEAERDAVWHLVEQFGSIDPEHEADRYVRRAQILASQLPEHLRSELLQFRTNGDVEGGLLIRGVPFGIAPSTPAHADMAIGMRLDAAKAMSIVGGAAGEQFGFQPELSGHIIQDILPVAGFEDTQQSISSRALLELHCETAFADSRADFVGLLCLRADSEQRASTLISTARDALALLDAQSLSILRQPRFKTTVDGSFLRGSGLSGPIAVSPIVVVAGSTDRPRIRCDFAETSGIDPEAQKAVTDLYHAADHAARGIRLEPGDLLFIDNHSTFHGRTPFDRTGDGSDRWLLRMFIARDLARSIASRPEAGRIVHIDYEALACSQPV